MSEKPDVWVRFERERIEVTSDGTLPPFKADVQREFVPGLATVYVTIDGVELPPMTQEQYAALVTVFPEEK